MNKELHFALEPAKSQHIARLNFGQIIRFDQNPSIRTLSSEPLREDPVGFGRFWGLWLLGFYLVALEDPFACPPIFQESVLQGPDLCGQVLWPSKLGEAKLKEGCSEGEGNKRETAPPPPPIFGIRLARKPDCRKHREPCLGS